MTVAAVNSRLTDAETATGYSNIGGGQAGAVEGSFFYQGSNLYNRKVTSTTGAGFAYDHGSTFDFTANDICMMAKVIVSDFGGLQATNGFRVRIGSAGTAYYDCVIAGSDSPVPSLSEYPAKGGFLIVPINPNIAGYRDGTQGSPDLSAVDHIGFVAAFSASTAKSENVGADAIDFGEGLELHTSGSLVDLITADEGTANNRYGYAFTYAPNVYGYFGSMFLGLSAGSPVATTITDSTRQSWLFPDGMFHAGWSGIKPDISNASTAITLSNKTLSGLGSETTEDTRPVLTVTGSSGSFDLSDSIMSNFAGITLTAGCSFTDVSVINSEGIVQGGAVLDTVAFSASPVASTESMMTVSALSSITDCTFVSGGSGHAIDLGTISSNTALTWANNDSGYTAASSGNETITVSVDSGITLDINVSAGYSAPSVRNTGLGTVNVNSGLITLQVTVLDDSTGSPINGAHVWLGRDSDKSELINGATNASGVINTQINFDSTTDVVGWAREMDLSGTDYTAKDISGQYTASGFSVTVRLVPI